MKTTPAPVSTALTGRGDVAAEAGELFDAARALAHSGTATGETWMSVLAQCASAKARLEATQTLALAHLAALDVVDAGCDDGTVVEQHRGLGHIRVDAPELVAPTLGLTPSGAGSRVRQAVSLMTRTPALVLAMADGRGDAYRAGIIADELAEAPAADARAVVAAVGDRFGLEAGGRLRSTVRRELNRVNPEVVQRQCLKARSNIGLRRWVNGDGTDTWQVEAPTETSRAAYAAVNDLALKVKKDTGVNIGAARATAMFQLILGRATGRYQVHVGIPMSVLADAAVRVEEPNGARRAAGADLVEVTGMESSGTTFVPRIWLAKLLNGTLDDAPPCEAAHAASVLGPAKGQGSTSLAASCAEVGNVRVNMDGVGCDDRTGGYSTAPIDPVLRRQRSGWLTESYHPTPPIKASVIARDGHCRFPGCTANARLCDLDHVIPWPAGPTTPTNLVLLCRRHHRVKQRPGWSVRLTPDGILAWTDPGGRRFTSEPFNHLAAVISSAVGRVSAGVDVRQSATCALESCPHDRADGFDPATDRMEEVIVGLTGRAVHTWTTVAGVSHDVHMVTFADCPMAWEFTGSWHGHSPDEAPQVLAPTAEPATGPSGPAAADAPGGQASWSDVTCADGDEPPF